MATYVPPKRATAYQTWVALRSQADSTIFQANPTLAAGDVKISKDGGALANITTLPTVAPAGGKLVRVNLDATEMTADVVKVVFSDASGAEWMDYVLVLPTAASQFNDLALATQVDALEGDTTTLLGRVPTALVGGRMDSSIGVMGANVLTAAALATDAVAEIVAAIFADAGSTVCSSGVLDAGGASSFTLPAGQRNNVEAGDMFYVPAKGARIIASGYNSTTGVGTTVSAGLSSFAASDPYRVFKLPKSEPLQNADLAPDVLTAANFANDVTAELQAGLATASALTTAQTDLTTLIGRLTAPRATLLDSLANLDAAVSTRAAQTLLTTVAGYVDTEMAAALVALAAIQAKTDTLPASPAAVGSAMTLSSGERTTLLNQLLTWSQNGGATGTRNLQRALKFLNNKKVRSGGNIVVYEDDNTTPSFTIPIGTDATAEPVVSLTPPA